MRGKKRYYEHEVKLYFQQLIGEVRNLQRDLIDLSNKGNGWDDISLETTAWKLESHYRSVCNSGAISAEGRLEELQEASEKLLAIAESLNDVARYARQLSRKIVSGKSRLLSQKLWYS